MRSSHKQMTRGTFAKWQVTSRGEEGGEMNKFKARGTRKWRCGCRESWSVNRREMTRSSNFRPCKKHSTIEAVFGNEEDIGIVKQMMCEPTATSETA